MSLPQKTNLISVFPLKDRTVLSFRVPRLRGMDVNSSKDRGSNSDAKLIKSSLMAAGAWEGSQMIRILTLLLFRLLT